MDTHNKLLRIVNKPSRVLNRLDRSLIRRKRAGLDLETERANLLEFLSSNFSVDAHAVYSEYVNSEFKFWFNSKKSELVKFTGKKRGISSDFDCELLYLLIRSAKPRIVVETGVLFGASSSHILRALKENGTGQLYSIDLPNDLDQPSQDFFVQDIVKDIWHLIIGDSKVELPKLLNRLNRIDLFHHDSWHTFDHMSWEFHTAFKHLSPKGVLSSHDVISSFLKRNAFSVFCKKHHIKYRAFGNIGVALCNSKAEIDARP